MAAVSANDAWAVGYYYNGTGDRTLTEHWDGTAWSIIASPNPGTGNDYLSGVIATSSDRIWAVGYYNNTSGPAQTLVEFSGGTAWTVVLSPNIGTNGSYLTGIAPASPIDIWAVGNYLSISVYRTLIEHWNGSAWSVVTSPNSGTVENYLYGVAPVSSTDVWAAGFSGSGSVTRTMVQHSTPCEPTSTATPTGTRYTPTITRTGTPTSTPGGATNTPSATPSHCSLQFEDVPNPSTFYPSIECLACRGILNGYPCGGAAEPCNSNNDPYFRPHNNVTRGQLAKILARAAGINNPVSGQSFEDVTTSSPFYTYIEQLYALGVLSGFPCGGAGEPCIPPGSRPLRSVSNATRGQLAKIDSNTAGFIDPPSGQNFQDIPSGSTFYPYIQRLAVRGIISGYTCGGPTEPCVPPANLPYFRPHANITRAQTSKFAANTFFPNCQTPDMNHK